MRKFDTKVQYLKYKVLREVARQAWNDTLLDNVLSIPRAAGAPQCRDHLLLRLQGASDPQRTGAHGNGWQ